MVVAAIELQNLVTIVKILVAASVCAPNAQLRSFIVAQSESVLVRDIVAILVLFDVVLLLVHQAEVDLELAFGVVWIDALDDLGCQDVRPVLVLTDLPLAKLMVNGCHINASVLEVVKHKVRLSNELLEAGVDRRGTNLERAFQAKLLLVLAVTMLPFEKGFLVLLQMALEAIAKRSGRHHHTVRRS